MWKDEFAIHAILGQSLLRTIDQEESFEMTKNTYIPALNHAVREVIEDGPIHMNMPQTIPHCADCEVVPLEDYEGGTE